MMGMIAWLAAMAICSMLAFGAGYSIWRCAEGYRRRARHKRAVHDAQGAREERTRSGSRDAAGTSSGIDERVLDFMRSESMRLSVGHGAALYPQKMVHDGWLDKHGREAGLSADITPQGLCEARLRLALGGAAVGFVIGLMFSSALALILTIVGAYFGWRAPIQAIKHRIEWRANQMERHLPEMLDVVAIGMRSGLSFDRSLEIYHMRFDSLLAGEFALAQRQWSTGLARRDEALRNIAGSYDSAIFARVMESCIRSLRFGSSMVEGMEASAREARVSYRTKRQEQVAKAPVKMMIPTGTLILPAMLILVLGPVLLELIGGAW